MFTRDTIIKIKNACNFIFKARVWPVIVLPGSYHADRQRTVSELIQSFVTFVISFKRKLFSLKATMASYTPCFLSNTFILAYFFSLTYKTSSFRGHSTQNKRYLSTSPRSFLKRMKEKNQGYLWDSFVELWDPPCELFCFLPFLLTFQIDCQGLTCTKLL